MKPAPFDYQTPATLREAISLLGSHPEAAVIAGGQSLIPVLAFRLATPSLLVDLRRVRELDYIGVDEDGVRLGALVLWRAVEDDRQLVAAHPLLREAVAHVAHYQIRNRGTVGGRATLERHVQAWRHRRNAAATRADWQFTTNDARIKLRKLYPTMEG